MDTELLVTSQIEEGQRLVEQLVRDGFDVEVAFWVKTSEEGLWHLFIASPLVDAEKLGEAYRKAYASMNKIPEIGISPVDITLVSSKNPIAQDAVAMRGRHPGSIPTSFHARRLGGLSVKEAYIYPPLVRFRLSFSVAYHRVEKSNTWKAKTKREALFRDIKAKGAVAYSTGRWEGEKAEDADHATVSVLLEVDPEFVDESLRIQPNVWEMVTNQAKEIADHMFKARHPDAVIEQIGNDQS